MGGNAKAEIRFTHPKAVGGPGIGCDKRKVKKEESKV